ncbi:hypothetical protein EFK50_16155 [Nocardioides marmoriginsengisoli]|uniref:Uncharacterized protein n=1 Tax=Nocardioides marmoriginsengisoli TaxID=661483 RepID=A0A3N0CIW8_9ACTN|nr:hypothetical protein EFK50_16155 [Nocardioides marmoriginsengisoli]
MPARPWCCSNSSRDRGGRCRPGRRSGRSGSRAPRDRRSGTCSPSRSARAPTRSGRSRSPAART